MTAYYMAIEADGEEKRKIQKGKLVQLHKNPFTTVFACCCFHFQCTILFRTIYVLCLFASKSEGGTSCVVFSVSKVCIWVIMMIRYMISAYHVYPLT